MHSLVGYGSDDDLDESPPPRKSAWQLGNQIGFQSQTRLRSVQPSQADVNYEEVQMDLSEDSNDSDPGSRSKNLKKPEDNRPKHPDSDKEDRKDRHRDDRDKDRDKSTRDVDKDRPRGSRSDDKYKSGRDENGEKEWHRTSREDEPGRDRYRSDREDKYRDERVRDDKYRKKDDEDKYRDRDRDRGRDHNRDKYRGRRSSSRDRRSRSPRRSEYKRRSRSGSRDRGGKSGYSRRYDRGSARMGRIEKLGIDIKSSAIPPPELEVPVDTNNRFYMPGITGRFTEQIQRRKLLWQKNKDSEKPEATTTSTVSKPTPSSTTASNPKTGKLWETTTFAQDQDGKVANKFKRLMGIRDNTADGIKPTSELIKKQEEMFSSMEAQYEVARTATHTMRGVGLGFGSFQR